MKTAVEAQFCMRSKYHCRSVKSDEVTLRAIRGATTVEADVAEDISHRVRELLTEIFARNEVAHEEVVSVLFTATDDLHSVFPASAAREMGLGDVPLICARELDIVGAVQRCVRVMLHVYSTRTAKELRHVYLHGAANLRDDLPE